jgi:hypothetical protein
LLFALSRLEISGQAHSLLVESSAICSDVCFITRPWVRRKGYLSTRRSHILTASSKSSDELADRPSALLSVSLISPRYWRSVVRLLNDWFAGTKFRANYEASAVT